MNISTALDIFLSIPFWLLRFAAAAAAAAVDGHEKWDVQATNFSRVDGNSGRIGTAMAEKDEQDEYSLCSVWDRPPRPNHSAPLSISSEHAYDNPN